MRTRITNYLKKSLLFTACAFSYSAFALDYTTINDGDWNDPTIWSTDGGATPCGCIPSYNTNGDNIYIQDAVNMTGHVSVSGGSTLDVTIYGHLWGAAYNLTVTGGSTVELHGNSTFQKITNGTNAGMNGGTINIYVTIVEVTGQIRLNAGTIYNAGYLYMPSGNFNVYKNGAYISTNGSKLELFGGNITNEGLVDICEDCCLTTTGNWTNEATGTVSGSGSATTTSGNMSNFGLFSSAITWCSVGFDVGMPSAEDCTTSNTTCGAVMLPVELVSFDGTVMRDHNLLTWMTASEKDCYQFVVTTSTDGMYWEPIGTISCNGTTTAASYYEYRDYDFTADILYYRLEQVDVDGVRHYSTPVSISRKQTSTIKCYPNPATMGSTVFISGTEGYGDLNVYGPTGTVVYSAHINQPTGGNATIETGSFRSGVYLVEYTNSTGIQRTKFVVQ